MKNSIHTVFSKVWRSLILLCKYISASLTRRIWLKLLSLVLALLIWAYIVSSTPSLTRTRTIDDIQVSYSSTANLTSYTLAISTDVGAQYVDVTVELPQSQYSRLTSRNIRVTPDYSSIRSAGVYDVPLSATTTYGTVTRITPSTISVTVENLESRVFPIEAEFLNEDTDCYWYDNANAALNPQQVTVTGPSSLVQSVDKAVICVDTSGRTGSMRRTFTTELRDSGDNVITSKLLTRSSSASYATLNIYPKKTLEVYVDTSLIDVEDGYRVDSVSFQPSSITVAGDAELLDAITYLPLDVSGIHDVAGSFSKTLYFDGLDEFKYCSAKSVYITVTVSEIGEIKDGQ